MAWRLDANGSTFQVAVFRAGPLKTNGTKTRTNARVRSEDPRRGLPTSQVGTVNMASPPVSESY
jgi:hypothetical protein